MQNEKLSREVLRVDSFPRVIEASPVFPFSCSLAWFRNLAVPASQPVSLSQQPHGLHPARERTVSRQRAHRGKERSPFLGGLPLYSNQVSAGRHREKDEPREEHSDKKSKDTRGEKIKLKKKAVIRRWRSRSVPWFSH